jgi:hypothetical protein
MVLLSMRRWEKAMPRRTNDPQHWRDRAAQTRLLASKMAASDAAILLNDLAFEYDLAAIRANGKEPPLTSKPG